MKKTIKHPKEIPATVHVAAEPPPLEFEPPHKKLARLTNEHTRVTEELQTLKRNFAAENIRAQQCRQAIPTTQITFIENKKRELAQKLMDLQSQIGETNRQVRAQKAQRQNGKRIPDPEPARRNGIKQVAPIKRHVEFPAYFLLAAEAELDARMFTKITGVAKSMLQNAVEMGIEGND
jgi:hypothetical protein